MWLISFPVLTTDLKNDIQNASAVLKTEFSKRFANDKTVSSESDCVFLLDGVLLNKRELLAEYRCETLCSCVKRMHEKASLFFSEFRGPFTGFYYDRSENCFLAYGNQTGDAALYYHYNGNQISVSSDFNALFDFCKARGEQLTMNPTAVNHMLSFGFLVEGNTVAAEIKKLNPGEYISVKNGKIDVYEYHHFQFGHYTITNKKEAIKAIDEGFRKAVKRCFDKDIEYGYENHLADISGGLDSRMTNWVAKTLGYHPIYNTCYAKKNSRDEEYAKLVSDELQNGFYYEALDDISFLYDLEKLVRMNFGQAVYCGITGGERMLARLDFEKYGLEHTGQLGGAIVSYSGVETDKEIQLKSICYSTVIEPKISPKKTYTNGEEFSFYYRFFHGTLSTHFIRRNYTEAVSPFIDVDFLQLCLNISDQLRRGHKLYWAWIKACYPKAAKIPSTRNRGNLRMNIYHKLPTPIARGIIRICKGIGLISIVSDKRGMNPFDYWYASDEKLRSFIDRYYEAHKNELESELLKSVDRVFRGERTIDKLQALTVLASNHIYFCKTDR